MTVLRMTAILSNNSCLEQQSNSAIQNYVYVEFSMWISKIDVERAKKRIQRVRQSMIIEG